MSWVSLVFLVCVFVVSDVQAAADEYPVRPIKIVVPFPPGGSVDAAIRPLASELERGLAVPVLIENRGGADGAIGTVKVAKSPPDGYTLLCIAGSFVTNPSTHEKVGYDPIRDFAPITQILRGNGYVVVVGPLVPANTVKELIALGRRKDIQVAYGSAGIGNPIHIATELFNRDAGTHFVHVPYTGLGPALAAALSGQVQLLIVPPAVVVPYVNAGRLKALGVTGRSRIPELPNTPTISEAGVGFVFEGNWIGLFAPAGTPKSIINRLTGEVRRALLGSSVGAALARNMIGYSVAASSPEEFTEQVKRDVLHYAELVRALNIKPE